MKQLTTGARASHPNTSTPHPGPLLSEGPGRRPSRAGNLGRVAVVGILCLAGGQATAQTNPAARRVTLNECISAALLRNRELQIIRINPEIAQFTLNSSYGYYDPTFTGEVHTEKATEPGGFDPADPSNDSVYTVESEVARAGITGFLPSGASYLLNGNYANSVGTRDFQDFDSYKVGIGASIRQPLLRNLWIDQGRLAIRINKRNLKISELGVAWLTMDVINRVQQAYVELLFARENHTIRQRLLETRQQTLSGTRRKIEEGLLSAADAAVTEAQVASAEVDLITASNVFVLAGNNLRTLIGDDFADTQTLVPADHLLAVPQSLNLYESRQRGLAQRPDLKQLRYEIEKTQLDLKFWRNQLFPSLDVVAGYGRKGASTSTQPLFPPAPPPASLDDAITQVSRGEAPTKSVGLILTLPLSLTAERGNFRASKQLKEQALLLLKQKEELVLREISDAIHNAETALQRITASRRARMHSQAALDAEDRKLAGGKSTIFFVLALQNDMATTQANDARARADYNNALSQLGFADASLLDTYRLSLDIR